MRAFAVAALAAVLVLAGSASASSASSVRVDVVAWPGEAAGALEWKSWTVVLDGDGAIGRLSLSIPVTTVRVDALRSFSGEAPIGNVSIAIRNGDDVAAELFSGGCGGERELLHFHQLGRCVGVSVTADGSRLVLEVDLSGFSAATAFVLQLDNASTPAGQLLAPNPEQAYEAETAVEVLAGGVLLQDTVREVVGGDTGIAATATSTRVPYGARAALAGDVRRSGAPSPAERVIAYPLAGGVSVSPVTTNEQGRFTIGIRPRFTSQWAVHASRAGIAGIPDLNSLVHFVARPVVVYAPRPALEKRTVRKRGRTRTAAVVVRNPLFGDEALDCRLYVGGRRLPVRRFGVNSATLTFHVRARAGTRIRAAVGRWGQTRPIDPGWSRTVRL